MPKKTIANADKLHAAAITMITRGPDGLSDIEWRNLREAAIAYGGPIPSYQSPVVSTTPQPLQKPYGPQCSCEHRTFQGKVHRFLNPTCPEHSFGKS